MIEVIARRQFSVSYIWLDIAFLIIFAGLLFYKKKYLTIIIGLLIGLLYMVVDYGIFHKIYNARVISPGNSMFWVLLWMSVSYGFTNFSWIWLWISKDKRLFEWSFLILLWWFVCPIMAKGFSSSGIITIERTTAGYHIHMALILFIGYLAMIVYNLIVKAEENRINILWLLIIGVLVQFGWEAGLLIGGIRSAGFDTISDKLKPLIINSLLETNLGMPIIYLIFLMVTSRYTEDLKRRDDKISLQNRIAENNRGKVRS